MNIEQVKKVWQEKSDNICYYCGRESADATAMVPVVLYKYSPQSSWGAIRANVSYQGSTVRPQVSFTVSGVNTDPSENQTIGIPRCLTCKAFHYNSATADEKNEVIGLPWHKYKTATHNYNEKKAEFDKVLQHIQKPLNVINGLWSGVVLVISGIVLISLKIQLSIAVAVSAALTLAAAYLIRITLIKQRQLKKEILPKLKSELLNIENEKQEVENQYRLECEKTEILCKNVQTDTTIQISSMNVYLPYITPMIRNGWSETLYSKRASNPRNYSFQYADIKAHLDAIFYLSKNFDTYPEKIETTLEGFYILGKDIGLALIIVYRWVSQSVEFNTYYFNSYVEAWSAPYSGVFRSLISSASEAIYNCKMTDSDRKLMLKILSHYHVLIDYIEYGEELKSVHPI